MRKVSYTVQRGSRVSDTWNDVRIGPHHDTLDEARDRVHRGKMRNPGSEYRIIKVTREVVE